MIKRIATSFTLCTPESIEHGDVESRGWIDEEEFDCTPDDSDRREDITAVDNAVQFLKREYVEEASSHPDWSPGTWYTGATIQNRDHFEKGHDERHSFHLYGFTETEEREIFKRIMK